MFGSQVMANLPGSAKGSQVFVHMKSSNEQTDLSQIKERLSAHNMSATLQQQPNIVMADEVLDNSEIEFDQDDSEEEQPRPSSAAMSQAKVTVK